MIEDSVFKSNLPAHLKLLQERKSREVSCPISFALTHPRFRKVCLRSQNTTTVARRGFWVGRIFADFAMRVVHRNNGMEFKDELRRLINENGGMTAENLQLVAKRAREGVPYFTRQRLNLLLAGHPPNNDDRKAISHALEPDQEKWLTEYWHLEDAEHRRIARRAYAQMKNHYWVKSFVGRLDAQYSFRDANLSDQDIDNLVYDELQKSSLEVEIDVFGLDDEGR